MCNTMCMTVAQLISLLRELPPRAHVATWDVGRIFSEGEELRVEQVIHVPAVAGEHPGVVVLGLDIDGPIVEGAEVIWAADESAAAAVEQAQGKWAKARREHVG